MKYLFSCLAEVKKKIDDSQNQALLLDFDGTLSKIAKAPERAVIKSSTKKLLEQIKDHYKTAVISGREISDLKKKVAIKNLTYAGNHGLEWQIDGQKYNNFKIDLKASKKLSLINKKLKILVKKFSGLLSEDKKFSLSLHYRMLAKNSQNNFLKEVKKLLQDVKKDKEIRIINGKKVVEFRPNVNWDKGHFAEFLKKHIEKESGRSVLLIYLGDDTTDEDAFLFLKNEITVRVGKKNKSMANYFIKQSELNKFLSYLLSLKNN